MEKNEIGGYESIRKLGSSDESRMLASTEKGEDGKEVYHFYYAGSLLI